MIDFESMAKEAAGNWQKFESFGWHDAPEDGENWTVVYTHNRDSDLLAESNASAIEATMKEFDEETVIPQRHGHWACGWVEGYAIKVRGTDGTITPAFKAWCELEAALESYPVLDDENYSKREYEASIENIRDIGRCSGDDAAKVYMWLWDNEQRETDPVDGGGAYPSEASVKRALSALGLVEKEEE